MLGSCCLQLSPFSSGCFGSKKQLLGALGAELEVVRTEGGRLGACKAVGSSPSARSFVTQSEQGEGFGGTQTPWVAAGLDPDGASLFPQHQAVSGSVHAAESPGSPGCSGWADLWPAQWWLEDEEEQQELLGRSPGAVTLARCSAARGPGTAAGAGGGRRGTAPAAVKRRYGLERHQQGSAWSIGSHRRGARAGHSLRGQILLPGTEWVTFTWPPARPEVGEGGFQVRKAPRGSTSLVCRWQDADLSRHRLHLPLGAWMGLKTLPKAPSCKMGRCHPAAPCLGSAQRASLATKSPRGGSERQCTCKEGAARGVGAVLVGAVGFGLMWGLREPTRG